METTLTPFGIRYPHLFDAFRQEMDRVMSRFFEPEGTAREEGVYTPPLNLAEYDDRYELWLDLPGVHKDTIDIEFKDGQLWISGKRDWNPEGREWRRIECPHGEFRRVVTFGRTVTAEGVEAELHDGVLHVVVPKAKEATTKHIQVKAR